jgi:hypothetical protein
MAVESASHIDELDEAKPAGSEDANLADDYIRLIKTVLKTDFGAISGAVTATHTELNILDGVTATATELNKLDGVTATTAELNYLSGVTSNIQAQLNGKMSAALSQEVKTDNFTATANMHYILRTNSSKTATLPATPSAGQLVWLTNHSGGNWTVDRNGSPIMGAASNDTQATNTHYEYQYIDSTTGWARFKSS